LWPFAEEACEADKVWTWGRSGLNGRALLMPFLTPKRK
jgi:hypothetical protein